MIDDKAIIKKLASMLKTEEKAHVNDLKTILDLIVYIRDNDAQIASEGLTGIDYIEALVLEMLEKMIRREKL